MSSSCRALSAKRGNDASINATELLYEKLQSSPKEDWERLRKCWGYGDCGDCHRSDGFCGWCAISSTCLPLPTDPLSKAFPLLSPIRFKNICALGPERFELRTAGLGCQVSTITFLTSIVTIFCTLFGVFVLYGLAKCIGLLRLGARAKNGGYVLYEDGTGEVWVRKSKGWGKWWQRMMGEEKEFEVEEIDDGTRKRGFFWWNTRNAERRPLLE